MSTSSNLTLALELAAKVTGREDLAALAGQVLALIQQFNESKSALTLLDGGWRGLRPHTASHHLTPNPKPLLFIPHNAASTSMAHKNRKRFQHSVLHLS